jgi:glycosyltransferase 2 family protein
MGGVTILIVEEQQPSAEKLTPSNSRRLLSWFNGLMALALLIWGGWYVISQITLVEIGRALALANPWYIALALLVFLVTLLAKAWRWQWQFMPRQEQPSFSASFWAMMLGQFVNTAVAFMRLGELARVYALYQQSGISKLKSLGTLVLEKTLDLIMLLLTLILIIPFVVVPDFITEQGVSLGLAALVALIILYLLAYQTGFVLQRSERLLRPLPDRWGRRLLQFATAGLSGLAALRSKRSLLSLLSLSGFIACLSVLMPLTLFPAFGLPFGPVEAVLINLVVTVAAALPVPTPGKIGVFEFAVVFMLRQFGYSDEATAFSYAVVFHLLIIGPQLFLGALAAWRTDWRWSKTAVPPANPPQLSQYP